MTHEKSTDGLGAMAVSGISFRGNGIRICTMLS